MPGTYLDHAATTTALPASVAAIAAELELTGNPSSLHAAGRGARRRLEECRERLAGALGARPSEVVFTSGGTESDNIGVLGLARARRALDPRRRRIVVSAVEHSAVLDSATHLEGAEDGEVTWVPVGPDGIVRPDDVRAAVEDGPGGPSSVALVAVMWVNNEIGTVQPIAEIAEIAAAHNLPMHTDAVQAVGKVPVDFAASGATVAALTGHKLGGPVGIGALLATREAPLVPLSFGGGQERQLRSGTLATALVVGLTAAVVDAVEHLPQEAPRLAGLRDRLIRGALAAVPGTRVTGAWADGDVTRRSPANAHLLLPDCDGDALLFLLDAEGIACSIGSACHAGVPQPSHVLRAMGLSEQEARGALRLSFGRTSTPGDVDHFLAVLPRAVERAQRAHRAARAVG